MYIKLEEEKYNDDIAMVICYPYPTEEEYMRRVKRLKAVGIKGLILEGTSNIGKYRVLGKGFRGIVVRAKSIFGDVAVKLRRVDSPRDHLLNEAKFLKIANSIGVGPLVYTSDRDFIVMEYIAGTNLPQWIVEEEDETLIEKVVLDVLTQAMKLDLVGLDHGELSRPIKHVLVTNDGKPYIIDFESASLERRPKNLTGLIQYLFIRDNEVGKKLRAIFEVDKEKLIKAIRQYKKTPSIRTFKIVLKELGGTI